MVFLYKKETIKLIYTWPNNQFTYSKSYKFYIYLVFLFKKKTKLTFNNNISILSKKHLKVASLPKRTNYGIFLNYIYYFKNHLSSDRRVSFLFFNFNSNIIKFNLFFSNSLVLKWNILFFSNKLFLDDLNSYNWFFLKKLKSSYFFNFFMNFNMFIDINITINNRLKLLNKKFFYIVDTLYNHKVIVFFWKISRVTIGSPYNIKVYNLLFFPIINPTLMLSLNTVFLIDIFYFNYTIFLKKTILK